MMIISPTLHLKGRYLYAGKIQSRLALHLKLDQVVREAMNAYVHHHWGDSRYWETRCQPYLKVLAEHYRFARFSSRSLKHYQQHVGKVALHYPHRVPSPKHAQTLLALVEMWYWREY